MLDYIEHLLSTGARLQRVPTYLIKSYSHIINPATGYPATGLCSVTVFGPDAETANGLSTSLMVLSSATGLQLLQQFPDYSCIMITDTGKVIRSKNFRIKKFKNKIK